MGACTVPTSRGGTSGMLVPRWPTFGGTSRLDPVVLLEARIVCRRSAGLLETADRSLRDPVLRALHCYPRCLHGWVSLVAHRQPADPYPGLHGMQRCSPCGALALLLDLSPSETVSATIPWAGGCGHLRPAASLLDGDGRHVWSCSVVGTRGCSGRHRQFRSDDSPGRDLRLSGRRCPLVFGQRGLPGAQFSH